MLCYVAYFYTSLSTWVLAVLLLGQWAREFNTSIDIAKWPTKKTPPVFTWCLFVPPLPVKTGNALACYWSFRFSQCNRQNMMSHFNLFHSKQICCETNFFVWLCFLAILPVSPACLGERFQPQKSTWAAVIPWFSVIGRGSQMCAMI